MFWALQVVYVNDFLQWVQFIIEVIIIGGEVGGQVGLYFSQVVGQGGNMDGCFKVGVYVDLCVDLVVEGVYV